MDYSKIIKEIGRGKNHARDLDYPTAYALYKAMLAEQVPALELGGILIAFRIKGESEQEILGFYQAMQEQVMPLRAPAGRPLPVVIPSYNGARKQANLTPLLALLLWRLGLPVVVHGVTEDSSRVTSAEIFQQLNIPWSLTAAEAQQRLDDGLPVFIPVSALSSSLDNQLQQRWRMGVRNSSHTLAKLATPFIHDEALRLASVSHPEYMQKVGGFLRRSMRQHCCSKAPKVRCMPTHYAARRFIISMAANNKFCSTANQKRLSLIYLNRKTRRSRQLGLSAVWRGKFQSLRQFKNSWHVA